MASTSLKDEQAEFEQETVRIEAWWKTDRQSHLSRHYSASTVAALRPTIQQTYLSSQQGLKLWNLLHEHRKNGTVELTVGSSDPLQSGVVAKYMNTTYVSGGIAGFTQVQYPGMDHADYPWDTVPNVAAKILNFQLWQDQRQRQYRMSLPLEQRAKHKKIDYLRPMIADGDMGFGGIPTIMKLTKAFVEAGVAMFHLDDLALGLKKFATGEGRTVIPTCEYIDRLRAARLQLDVMGVETLLLGRCDSDHAQYLTSVLVPRDHEYVIGATKEVPSLQSALATATKSGEDLIEAKKSWDHSASLMTFDEAVRDATDAQTFDKYVAALEFPTEIRRRRQLAREITGKDISFDWELPRTQYGQYAFKSCVKTIVERALAAVPLTDVTWARMDAPNLNDIDEFHKAVLKVHPARIFAMGWGPAWPFNEASGFPPGKIRTLSADLARDYNIVWQTQPNYALQGIIHSIEQFAPMFAQEGIGGYVENVQKKTLTENIDGVQSLEWCGAFLADAYFNAIDGQELAAKP